MTAPSPATPATPLRRGASVFLLASFGLALTVAAYQAWRSPHDADASAYVRALESHAGRLRAGDRVLVQPPWRLDVLDALEQEVQLARGVEVSVALSRAHKAPLGRVLVLQDPTWPLPRSLKRELDDAEHFEAGPLRVFWHGEPPPGAAAGRDGVATSAGDFAARLPGAEVYVETAEGQHTDCAYLASASRHVCRGLPSWMYVGTHSMQAGGTTETCIWSHPVSGGRVVTRFAGVTLPEAWELSAALSDQAAGLATGTPVVVSLRVAGDEVLRLERHRDRGFASVRTPRRERGGGSPEIGDVEVVVSASDDRMRHFCWRLRAGESSP